MKTCIEIAKNLPDVSLGFLERAKILDARIQELEKQIYKIKSSFLDEVASEWSVRELDKAINN